MITDDAQSLGRLITAMITPMNRDYSLDLDGAGVLVEHLVRTGTDSVLVNGSTGEAPVTTDAEKLSILRAVVEAAAEDVPVIAGVGTSSTEHSVSLAKDAERAGAAHFWWWRRRTTSPLRTSLSSISPKSQTRRIYLSSFTTFRVAPAFASSPKRWLGSRSILR